MSCASPGRREPLGISAGSRLLDCPRLWPESAHTYSGWSLCSWAAAAISSAGRGFSAFLHLGQTSFLLGWAGGWGVQVPPVPSACQGGDALSKPDSKQRCRFPEDLLKGACSRTREPGDSAPRARPHGWRLLCPSHPAARLSRAGLSRQSPALQLGVSPAPTPGDLPPRLPRQRGWLLSQRCRWLPVPGAAVGPPLQTRLPTPPILPGLAPAAPATASLTRPTLQTAAGPPGGEGNAAGGGISLGSWRGFLRL